MSSSMPARPRFADQAAFDASIGAVEPWVPMAAEALQRAGLVAPKELESIAVGLYPVVLARPDLVVKLYGPWRKGPVTMADEVRALELLAADPSLPVPRLVAHGELGGEWAYVVETFVPGVPFASVRAGLDRAAVGEVAAWAGDVVGRMHAVPVPVAARDEAVESFGRFIRNRHRVTPARLEHHRALPARLLDGLDAWMPPIEALLGPEAEVVPLHADLHGDHVRGRVTSDGFEPLGVIDFNRHRLGHPLYELGPVWKKLLAYDREHLGEFCQRAGLIRSSSVPFPKLALAWCLLHAGVVQSPIRYRGIDEVATLDELAEATLGR